MDLFFKLFSLLMTAAATIAAGRAYGLTIEIVAKGRSSIRIVQDGPTAQDSVGAWTVKVLQKNNISYGGSAAGILAINGLGSDLEVIDHDTMKAWGWCYSLDGVTMDQMPDQVLLTPTVKVVKWFYAYALYDGGTWTGYCIQ